jgi:predicted nucleotidyltransferase
MGTHSSKDRLNDPAAETTIGFPLPVFDADLFKHGATPYILNFLSNNPDIEVSIVQLSTVVPQSRRATNDAVVALEETDLVKTRPEGNAKMVHINRQRLEKPADPIYTVPQPEFRMPVRIAVHAIRSELSAVRGIVLFGSVATGEADRQSDIDLWVLVEDDPLDQRTSANQLASRLGEYSIPDSLSIPRRDVSEYDLSWEDIEKNLTNREKSGAGGQRFSFEIIVESPQSIVNQLDRVETDELFGAGITLHDTETLEFVVREMLDHE